MTAIAFVFAWLLAALAGEPAPAVPPAPPAATVPAHVGARPAGRFDSAPLAARPQGSQREDGRRGSNPQAPTSPPIATPGQYAPPGTWLDTPTPDDVAAQLPDETLGRALG